VSSYNSEYDAMINLTGVGQTPAPLNLKSDSEELFEEWDRLRRTEMHSSLLLAHLAANYLAPTGYVCFSSDLSVFNPATSFKGPILNQVMKAMIQKQGFDLSSDRQVEEVIYVNACVNLILHEPLITEKARKSPIEMKVYNRKLEGIAKLLKFWSSGEARPENGSFVGFDFSQYRNGSVVLPKYF